MKTPDKHSKPVKQNLKELDPIMSDQGVSLEKKEEIKKLLMKKISNDPVVLKQTNNNEPEKSANTDKKPGSHSLSSLHFFQNHHK